MKIKLKVRAVSIKSELFSTIMLSVIENTTLIVFYIEIEYVNMFRLILECI